MALNKRERLLLGTTVTLTVLGVNYLLLIPLTRNWTSLRSQLASSRRELEAMKATIQLAPEWQKKYTELGENLGRSAQFQQSSEVLRKLEDVGTASGIQLKDRRPLPAVEKDVYRELPFLCNFESTTETLVKFLYGLQTGSGFMNVEEIQVTPQADNPSILRCSIRIQALAGKAGGPKS